jgi:hypothetical protein
VSAFGTPLQHLADSPVVRRVLEAIFAARSRRHLARLDQTSPVRAQLRSLQGLVHRAARTAFGLDHDFRRIRSAADFRRLVPVRGPAELWRAYSQAGQVWPTPLAGLAVPHPALGEAPTPVWLSPELQASHRRALRTALALVVHARPRARLLDGRLLWLGDDTCHTGTDRSTLPPDRLAAGRFPFWLRVAARGGTSPGQDWPDLDSGLPAVARRLIDESPSCLVGPAERIAAFLDATRTLRGQGHWPFLQAVLYHRRDPDFSVERFRQSVGQGALLLELLTRPEAPVAVEDPRHGGLRLLADHGAYFEFVPADQIDRIHPPRLGLDQVRVGEPYHLVISSPAGLWACRSGLVLCFDRLSPPLVRALPGIPALTPVPDSVRADDRAEPPRPAPRPQTAGIPATPPGRPFHTLWSALAGRG